MDNWSNVCWGHHARALTDSRGSIVKSNHQPILPLGTLYRRHGTAADLALAHDLLSDGLRYDPTSTAAWLQLGLTCRGLGHREEAERNLRTAVAMVGSEPALPFSDCPLLTRLLPSVTF